MSAPANAIYRKKLDAPSEYGPRKTLYNRYVRWAEKGVWIDLFHAPIETPKMSSSRAGDLAAVGSGRRQRGTESRKGAIVAVDGCRWEHVPPRSRST
jgi:hypothetical protein